MADAPSYDVKRLFLYFSAESILAPQTPHLNGLHEREEERPDADAAAEQLDEPGGAEEAEEADVDDLRGVHDAPHHRDEVERVPRVLEVRLREDREVGLESFGR